MEHGVPDAEATDSRPAAAPPAQDGVKRAAAEPRMADVEVGTTRIRLYWGGDKAWYAGRVVSYSEKMGKHKVKYDVDGEQKYHLLEEELWEIDA
eukprot:4792718-Prymnesium_polylepis.1